MIKKCSMLVVLTKAVYVNKFFIPKFHTCDLYFLIRSKPDYYSGRLVKWSKKAFMEFIN